MQQPPGDARPGDLSIPLAQHLAPEGCETDPFGEALPVHLAPQHTELDQPDQVVFGAAGAERAAADLSPILPCGELSAAQSTLLQLPVELPPKRQAAHGLAGASQGVLVVAGGCGGGHAQASLPAILLVGASL